MSECESFEVNASVLVATSLYKNNISVSRQVELRQQDILLHHKSATFNSTFFIH